MALTLRPYQERSVEKLAGWGNGILGHDPGLGKTPITIRTLSRLGCERVLVVTTNSSVINWRREFQRWGPPSITPTVIPYSAVSHGAAEAKQALKAPARYDAVVFDEAHALKSAKSKRTQRCYGIDYFGRVVIDRATRRFSLSGTIAPNHYGDLWTHLMVYRPHVMREKGLDDYEAFLRRFCTTRETMYGLQVLGGRNVPELRELLKPVYHRYSQRRVLKDLPPLTVDTFPLQVSASQRKEAESLLAAAVPHVTADTLHTLALSSERRALGLLKAPAVAEFVIDELENVAEKLILFAHHREVIDFLADRLQVYAPSVVYGGQTETTRQLAIDTFQTDPNCRVFIGQISTAGEAITLTAAHHVVFAESSWVAAENYQALKRAHRITQEHPVLVRFLTLDGTLDDAIGRVVARKTQMTADLFD